MLYTRCVTNGDASAATQALKQHQREHIAWERDTVWRTMINQARRGADDATVLEGTPRVVPVEEKKGVVEIQTRMGRIKITKKMVSLVVAVVVGTVLLNVQTLEGAEASRCLAVLVFCTIMWATEVRLFSVKSIDSVLIALIGDPAFRYLPLRAFLSCHSPRYPNISSTIRTSQYL